MHPYTWALYSILQSSFTSFSGNRVIRLHNLHASTWVLYTSTETIYFLQQWPFTSFQGDHLHHPAMTIYKLLHTPFTSIYGDSLHPSSETNYFRLHGPFTYFYIDPLRPSTGTFCILPQRQFKSSLEGSITSFYRGPLHPSTGCFT